MICHTHSNRLANSPSRIHRHRRGAMFAYFMVYLSLAGAMTATAGMLLHQMFRARTADEDRGNGIRQLLRIDRQLRTDWADSIQHTIQANICTLKTPDQTSVEYQVAADRILRIVRNAESEIEASDRFQFPKGSQLQFLDSTFDGTSAVTFRLISPVPSQKTETNSKPMSFSAAKGRIVEIFLATSPKTNQTSSPSEDSLLPEADANLKPDAAGDDQ
ncbi:MAG: hypothetical protein ABJZ55_20615 [Fuerstiella sp.]